MSKPEATPCRRCNVLLDPVGFEFAGEMKWQKRTMCDDCIEIAEQEAKQAAEEAKQESRRRHFATWRETLRGQIGERIVTDDLQASKLLHKIVDGAFADKRPEECAAYVSGPVGTLKTRKAVESCLYYLHREAMSFDPPDNGYGQYDRTAPMPKVCYTTEVEMLDAMRPGGSKDVKFFRQRDYLVIDDIGLCKASEWTNQQLYQVIDHRYRHCLATTMISNLSLEQLKDESPLYDDRMIRRIAEMCGSHVVEVTR